MKKLILLAATTFLIAPIQAEKKVEKQPDFIMQVEALEKLDTPESSVKAYAILKREAEKGSVKAMLRLSSYLSGGVGTEKNEVKACDWAKKAAATDDPRSLALLGIYKMEGTGCERNEKEAFKIFKKSADLDFPFAQYHLGTMYIEGEGCVANEAKGMHYLLLSAENGLAGGQLEYGLMQLESESKKAQVDGFQWIEKAASQKHATATNALARCFHEGVGTSKNSSKALELYMKSAELGNADAQFQIYNELAFGSITGKESIDMEGAISWGIDSARGGNVEAQIEIGLLFFGHTQQALKSISHECLLLAHEQGSIAGSYDYSRCLTLGMGCKKDEKKALKILHEIAELKEGEYAAIHFSDKSSIPKSAYLLADIYMTGQLVLKDPKVSEKYLKIASELGNIEASIVLSEAYLLGEMGIDQDARAGFNLMLSAAESGSVKAQNLVSACYFSGIGVLKNPKEGIKWLKKSADSGFVVAQVELGRRYAEGDGAKKNLELAKVYIKKAFDNGTEKASEKAKAVWDKNELWKY